MPTPMSSPGQKLPRRMSTEMPPAPAWAGVPVILGLFPPPPTPVDVSGNDYSSRVTAIVKNEIPRPALAGTGTSSGKQE